MKHLFSIFCCLCATLAISQPNTEVYTMDLSFSEAHFTVSNFQNISQNDGYDNQPSFTPEGNLLFARTNEGQTDIVLYDFSKKATTQLYKSTLGGEYSPQRMPNSQDIAAVRLDPNGKQRLYQYRLQVEPKEVIDSLQVAYYAFYDENRFLSSVLAGSSLDLVLAHTKTQKVDTLLEGSGRSIHKVPHTESMSYTSVNEEGNWDIFQLDMENLESYFVAQLPIGIQDHIWLDEAKLLIGSGPKLFLYDLFGNGEWNEVADLSKHNIKDITRLAVSADGKKLAIVAEPDFPSPSEIVEAHIAPYNEGRLKDFVNAFSESVVVRNFPADTMYVGRDLMHANYDRFMKNNSNLGTEVQKRIVYQNVVIDEELVTVNDKSYRQATIYETGNGTIESMTFIIQGRKPSEDPTVIVDKQLEAYNARDIDAFMATYTEDIELYSFPHKLSSKGQVSMKDGYASFFKNTPDLNCTIKNRIVIGNKVIDEEFLTINGQNYSAIAIYEVENGLISKVTFIQ